MFMLVTLFALLTENSSSICGKEYSFLFNIIINFRYEKRERYR